MCRPQCLQDITKDKILKIINFINFINHLSVNNQTGATLILSLIILAAILATATTFTFVSISNFKQSVSVDDAIVSYYLAEIGVERGAYYFRRLSDDNLSDNNPSGCGIADCILLIEPKEKMVVPSLIKDKSIQLDVYNLSQSLNDIRYFQPTWTFEGFPAPYLEISWVGWTGSNFSNPAKVNLTSSGSRVDLHSQGIGNRDFYRVRFKALFSNINNLQIIAQNSTGVQQNIPGVAQVKAIGTYGRSRQANAITTTHLYPLSGLYDYLLFSEEELIKSYCGNGVVEGSEQCDNGSQCSDGTNCVMDLDCIGIGDEKCLPRDLGAGDYCNARCECKNPTTCN